MGCDNGVMILKQNSDTVVSLHDFEDSSEPTFVVEHENNTLVLYSCSNPNHNPDNQFLDNGDLDEEAASETMFVVEKLSSDYKQTERLFKFLNIDYAGCSPMTASSEYVAVGDHNVNSVILYNLATKDKTYLDVENGVNFIWFLPNGDFVLNDCENLTRYSINNGQLTELWVRECPENCYNITADEHGLLYVNGEGCDCIYILSPEDGMYGSKLLSMFPF